MEEVLQNAKADLQYDLEIPFLCTVPKDSIACYRHTYLLVFISILVTMSREWPRCSSMKTGKKNVAQVHNVISFSRKEKQNCEIWRQIDGARNNYFELGSLGPLDK